MSAEFSLPRTAIVTGAAKRIGAAIADALLEDGWHVVAHCHTSLDEARARHGGDTRVRIVAADLADPAAAGTIVATLDGFPPPALLVNNASRFAYDSAEGFTAADWDAHHAINLRAPALLTQAFAAAVPDGQAALIVNLHDAKLEAPHPDFYTYTLSKIGLAGLTELSARALAARGIRVCGIAPSVTLVSGPQSRENFAAVHALNPLGRGVVADDIVRALRFVVDSPALTGQVVTIDGGARFLQLARDVQFLDAN